MAKQGINDVRTLTCDILNSVAFAIKQTVNTLQP